MIAETPVCSNMQALAHNVHSPVHDDYCRSQPAGACPYAAPMNESCLSVLPPVLPSLCSSSLSWHGRKVRTSAPRNLSGTISYHLPWATTLVAASSWEQHMHSASVARPGVPACIMIITSHPRCLGPRSVNELMYVASLLELAIGTSKGRPAILCQEVWFCKGCALHGSCCTLSVGAYKDVRIPHVRLEVHTAVQQVC